MNTKEKVLIVRLDGIGDYVLFRNALRFIRNSARYRKASISVLGNAAWRNLAESFDYDCVDNWIWVKDRWEYFKRGVENLVPAFIWRRRVEAAQNSLRSTLREMHFDEVISPQPIRDPFLDRLISGIAPKTIGVKAESPLETDTSYTRLIDAGDIPFVFDRNRDFASQLAGERCNVRLELGDKLPKDKRAGVFICLGASHWTRILPTNRYLDLCEMILNRTSHHVFIAGGPKDVRVASLIRRKCPFPSRVTVLAGKLSLAAFAREVSKAKCAICNDTGSLHIAAATGAPSVCVANGVSGKDFFWPYPDGRIDLVLPKNPPLHQSSILPISQLQTYAAFSSITAEDVFNAARRHF